MSLKNLRNLLTILISTLLLSSCATILHEKQYTILIRSNEAKAKVKVYDSIYNLPAYAEVKRSNKDLGLTLMTETKNIEFRAKPKLTNTFKYVNLCLGLLSVVNYGVDLTNKKRFYYGKSILLNTKDSTVTIIKPKKDSFHYLKTKGEFDLHLSIPLVNSFNLKPLGEQRQSQTGGPFGICFGFDYYHTKNQFLNFSASGVIVGVTLAEGGETKPEAMYSTYVSFSNNHKIKRFSVGYGLSYSKNTWLPETTNYVPEKLIYRPQNPVFTPEPHYVEHSRPSKSNNALGLVFPAYFQLGKSFNIGIIYRPTFYRFTPTNQWTYEHLISLDFAWKIKL